jgi:hypothetical protein
MNDNGPSPEFRELVARLCDDDLTPDESARLEQIASSDAAALQYYVEYMDLHGTLRRHTPSNCGKGATPEVEAHSLVHDLQSVLSNADCRADSVSDDCDQIAAQVARSSQTSPKRFSRSGVLGSRGSAFQVATEYLARPLPFAAVVLASLSLLTVLMTVTMVLVIRSPATADAARPQEIRWVVPKFVARLSLTHSVKWMDAASSPMVGQVLAEGQVFDVAGGWAEITFKNGARLILEGPAVLEVQSADNVRLRAGKVVADVPESAKVFTVETPFSRIAHAGATFGVRVEPSQITEIEVFKGTINVNAILADTSKVVTPEQTVTAGQVLQIKKAPAHHASQLLVHRPASSSTRFVQSLLPERFAYGSKCIGREKRDTARGVVTLVRDATPKTGRAVSFSFYNIHSENDLWITPIILALDPTTGTYRITGIGQSVLNLGGGVQTVPFQLIAGSAELQRGIHTFGFYHGTVDKTGQATSASLGPLDLDHVSLADKSPKGESAQAASSDMTEARWLFTPGTVTPVPLRLGLEFNADPQPGQVALFSGSKMEAPERIYSGSLEIVTPPDVPAGESLVISPDSI